MDDDGERWRTEGPKEELRKKWGVRGKLGF
jgi:hypothetical protein